MKKIIAVVLCLLLIPAQAVSAQAPSLENTAWELVKAEAGNVSLDRKQLEELNYLIEFHFEKNGAVIYRTKHENNWTRNRGTYVLSGDALEIDIAGFLQIKTRIQGDTFTVVNFNSLNEDYTFRKTSAPASSFSSAGSVIGRVVQDFWWGAVIGAAAGAGFWLLKWMRKKKKAKPPTQGRTSLGVSVPTPPAAPKPAPDPISPTAAGAPPQLLCTGGLFAGAVFPVNGNLFIGRDPHRCQIIFPEDANGVSGLHCEVQPQFSSVLLIDRGSTYGTFLSDGRKLNENDRVVLNAGDSFYLADGQNSFSVQL